MSRPGRLPRATPTAPRTAGPSRRRFLQGTVVAAGAVSLGPAFWQRAFAAPAQPGESPYGPLSETPDALGLLLPGGFTSRLIAQCPQPVPGTSYPWHPFPDGAGTFATEDGGWILVSNSENPPPAADLPGVDPVLSGLGKVSAIRFAPDASIVDAYAVLPEAMGARSNCAGAPTPWGTWLSCAEFEEPAGPLTPYDGGKVWECDPTGATPAVVRPAMGAFKHEMAGIDTDRRQIYLSEDLPDGRFYRFTPDVWEDLSSGRLEVARVDGDGRVDWLAIDDPSGAVLGPTRSQQPGSFAFDGGEGCTYDSGHVYLTTKGDDRVWDYDVAASRITVLYDAAEFPEPVLSGVDNIIVSPQSGDIVVAEDGGNLEAVIITPDRRVAPLLRMTGPQHGVEQPTPFPSTSEVTGLAFSPDGTRLYFSSQRGLALGITYEITGPFRGSPNDPALAPAPAPSPSASPSPSADPGPDGGGGGTGGAGPAGAGSGRGTLPRTGGDVPAGLLGLGALAGALAAWRARRAAEPGRDHEPRWPDERPGHQTRIPSFVARRALSPDGPCRRTGPVAGRALSP
ncbi:hypothetical protein BH24ACT3_BH24ACT3_05480 [soil metagenome]